MANTLLLERPVKSERAVRQKREEWGQVGEAIVRAAVNNSSKPIFEELGKRVAELGTDEQRKNLGSALGNLRAGKTRQELEIALAKFGMEENSTKQLIRIIEINFSSYSEFGAIFESCGKSDAKSFAREFASKYAEMSGRVENYIWKSSDANIKAALNPLELSDYERPLANYLVRKHFGMTKEELAANLGAAKGDEISIVREFTESTVSDKAFQKARDEFKGAYGEFGAGEVLQSMDLLSQKAFLLDALPKLEKWGRGRENLGAFIRERLVPALADGVMPKQAIFPLFASEVHVERAEAGKGKLEKTAGTIAFLMDKTDYYFEDFRNAIFPLIVAKLGSVYNEGGLTRERAAFNFVSEQVQTALIKAQGAWFKRLIEGFLANPAAFSAFTQQVPQLRDSDLKSLSQQTADELIRLIDQRVIRPDSIKTPLDFSIMGLVQDKDVKNTLLKLRWAFSPGSLSIIPSVDWTKSVALMPPQDAFIYELMARPVPFRVNLPTVLTTGVFSGNANYSRKSADGITTAAEGTALVNYTMLGASGGMISSTLSMAPGMEGNNLAFSAIASDLVSDRWKAGGAEMTRVIRGEVTAREDGKLFAALENNYKSQGNEANEGYMYTMFERSGGNPGEIGAPYNYRAKSYLRDAEGKWYRVTFEDTADNVKRAFAVHYSANADVRALYDKDKIGAFIVGLKINSDAAASILKGKDARTMADEYGAIISNDAMGSAFGERAMTFMQVYGNDEVANVKKNYQLGGGQVGRETGSFWKALASAKGEHGFNTAWRKGQFEVNAAYLNYLGTIDSESKSNAALFGVRSGLSWLMGSSIREIDYAGATSRNEGAIVGATEWVSAAGKPHEKKMQVAKGKMDSAAKMMVDGKNDKARKDAAGEFKAAKTEYEEARAGLAKAGTVRMQASIHTYRTSGEQAISYYNDQIRWAVAMGETAMRDIGSAKTKENVSSALDNYRTARDQIEMYSRQLTAVKMVVGREYMGTLKVRVKRSDGETGLEAVGGEKSAMLNRYAMADGKGYQVIGALGDVKMAGGKALFKVSDLAIAMITGGVIVNTEFGTKLSMHGGISTRPESKAGTGFIAGGAKESEGKLGKDLMSLEATFFRWKDMQGSFIDGKTMHDAASKGWYAVIRGERGSYNMAEMDKVEMENYKFRIGDTFMSVNKNYATIESFEKGLGIDAGSTKNSEGQMDYFKVGPFVKFSRETNVRKGSIEGSIVYETDRYKGASDHKGDLLIFGLGGKLEYPINCPL